MEGQVSPQQERLSKRQHPGKRFQDDIEKEQHPGKRDEDEDTDYIDVLKRQHPGKREDESESYMEVQKRQHPGRRSLWDQYTDIPSIQVAYLSELSKRQHPGKRYGLLLEKRQHPGRRSLDEELDLGELQDLEKWQHPGKRYLDSDSEYSNPLPCDIQDPATCSKASLLLELLDNVNKSRAEEKRQHPGRRLTLEGGLTDLE
ncbi:pro-thyrotropin-releasing hormone-A-like [Polyodon spathula]|uniref:pro-thyrotropin-releasing hormone-A-like n=1 Tax=Polyodon spathula TaxID=7913 RepID=UPI001B7DE43F|nr:pro-thyrotropin-releasing hormone-A-like [Polyodon spathula]